MKIEHFSKRNRGDGTNTAIVNRGFWGMHQNVHQPLLGLGVFFSKNAHFIFERSPSICDQFSIFVSDWQHVHKAFGQHGFLIRNDPLLPLVYILQHAYVNSQSVETCKYHRKRCITLHCYSVVYGMEGQPQANAPLWDNFFSVIVKI